MFTSSLCTKNVDESFLPALEKMFNKYSDQASEVMIHCNRLLDRFYFMMFKAIDPESALVETLGKNRFCRLTIWTSGNKKDRVDGFTNNIHVDNDRMHKTFQEAASFVLQAIEEENLFDQDDIEYLKKLKETSKGQFQTPTVCGYDIVKKKRFNNETDLEDWNVFAYFALVGLGVSVKLDHCYHSFMAASVSHCTPTPISIAYNIVTTHTGGDINVVGWGGGGNEQRREFYETHGGIPVDRLTQRIFAAWLGTVSRNIQILARTAGIV